MVRVNVCRYLEYESRKLGFVGAYGSFFSLCDTGAWSYFNETVKELLYAEVIQGTAEENRSYFRVSVILHVERRIHTVHEFKVIPELACIAFTDVFFQLPAVNVNLNLFSDPLLVGLEQVELVFINVVDTLELRALVYRPRQRPYVYFEFLFQFIEQVERVSSFPVHLVDEDYDGCVAHPADIHQLSGLRLYALCPVNYNDG